MNAKRNENESLKEKRRRDMMSHSIIYGEVEATLALPSAMDFSLAVKGRQVVTGSHVYPPTPRNKAVRIVERGQQMNK